MSRHDNIVWGAYYESGYGEWRVWPEELISFFKVAGCEQVPTEQEAKRSMQLSTGAYVGGQIRHWCGIFACYVWRRYGGVDAKWTLHGGKIGPLGDKVRLRWGRQGLRPGDIAIIPRAQHHFIIGGVNGTDLWTIEGNTSNQKIVVRERKLNPKDADQTIYAYYTAV
jgi:hypothetical protein